MLSKANKLEKGRFGMNTNGTLGRILTLVGILFAAAITYALVRTAFNSFVLNNMLVGVSVLALFAIGVIATIRSRLDVGVGLCFLALALMWATGLGLLDFTKNIGKPKGPASLSPWALQLNDTWMQTNQDNPGWVEVKTGETFNANYKVVAVRIVSTGHDRDTLQLVQLNSKREMVLGADGKPVPAGVCLNSYDTVLGAVDAVNDLTTGGTGIVRYCPTDVGGGFDEYYSLVLSPPTGPMVAVGILHIVGPAGPDPIVEKLKTATAGQPVDGWPAPLAIQPPK